MLLTLLRSGRIAFDIFSISAPSLHLSWQIATFIQQIILGGFGVIMHFVAFDGVEAQR